jgi:hypothetical protein
MTYKVCYWDEVEGVQRERDATPEEAAEIDARKVAPPSRDELKAERQAIVDAITVTVNGKVFNGDETSQGRMNRALRVADITGQASCTWVLADNIPATVTKDELAQALALAMEAQAQVWVLPTA